MAATGFTPISLYYSTTAAAVPTAGNLVPGELAINIADGKLYYENSSGVVTLLAAAAGASGDVVGPASSTTNGVALFDGTTGKLLQSPSTITYASSTLSLPTIAPSANLAFTGTGNRITGDFSNATIANRVLFQTSTTNGTTQTALIPNGTGTASTLEFYNGSDPANAQLGQLLQNANEFRISASYRGTPSSGTFLPLTMSVGGSERLRLDTTGQVYINGTSGTGLLTIASSNTYPALKVPNIVEATNIVAGAPASTQVFYLGSGAVQYYTSNAANNWTVNFAMSAGTALNTAMAVGDSMSCTMLTTQGATAYYNSSVQVDGTTSGVTTKWQGSAPTSGNASSIDVYTYVIIKTASATYTVLASQTKFA